MIQRFSLWKTILVVISLIIGAVYGLPNGFPDDPAVQITSNRSSELLSELDVIHAEEALKVAGIKVLAREFEGSQALIRFDSVETQIKAKSVVQQALGANFIVTPVLRDDIALVCNRRKVLWSAGCGSLTEIAKAEELGGEIVKLFPGSTYGPDFVKAIKGPQPWTSIMPTGGVSTEEDNLRGWFEAGVTCVGMGSKLISKEVLANGDYEGLKTKVALTLALIQKIRQ